MPAPQAMAGPVGIAALRRRRPGDGSLDIDFFRRRAQRLRHAARSRVWHAARRLAAEAFAALSTRGSDTSSAAPTAAPARCAPADA